MPSHFFKKDKCLVGEKTQIKAAEVRSGDWFRQALVLNQ